MVPHRVRPRGLVCHRNSAACGPSKAATAIAFFNDRPPKMHPDDLRKILFLLNNRVDSSDDGGASLLDRAKLNIR